MKRLPIVIFLLLLPSLQGCLQANEDAEMTTIRLATTTSLRDSGLLSVLLPEFTDETDNTWMSLLLARECSITREQGC